MTEGSPISPTESGQDSLFQFLVLLALVVLDAADQRGKALHDGHRQPVQDLVVFLLGGCDVTVLEHGLHHRAPHLQLVHTEVREAGVSGRHGVCCRRSVHGVHVERWRVRVEGRALKKSLLKIKN
jgi:hypothetical protein